MILLRALLVASVAAACCASGRGDEPRAVIERAVKAMGAEVDPAKRPAIRLKIKFKGGGSVTGTGELLYQRGTVRKCDLVATDGTERHTLLIILDATSSWVAADGANQPLGPEEANMLRAVELLFAPSAALPLLLDDKAIPLRLEKETTHDGKAVQVVEVSLGGKQTLSLFFDKETGLPVKTTGTILLGSGLATEVAEWQESGQAADERVLTAAGVEPAALREYLRKQMPDPAKSAQAAALVKRLGDDSFEVREKAEEDLLALGTVALPHLERALKDRDAEISRRAQACLEIIAKRNDDAVLCAAVREVVWCKLDGGDEALLALLPAANAVVAGEIKAALAALNERDGKPRPALLKALDDKDAVVRAAAAALLGKDGGEYLKQPGRRLFVAGPKVPAKIKVLERGKPVGEMDVTEAQLFNHLEAKLFVKP
jgi:hypothetical protein